METWSLPRTQQCAKCPWKLTTDPRKIPDGYSKDLHKKLKSTIAEPGSVCRLVQAMACHESSVGAEEYCIGWLHNQLGTGNNIAMRLHMMSCSNRLNRK
ncbi:DUF6283 family protein [Rivularia sp. UHCC 0363]|uniref:DUF6283 family protein n=1 Tax=Rivularia sp. UHCC 0363 TaxID=3110244 RepID=UPI003A599993